MIDTIYNYSLVVGWIILFTLGTCLLMAKTTKKDVYHTYHRSRRIMGVAFLLYGLQILLQWIFEFRTSAPHIAAALNITCFYMGAILFGMSFISLLDPSYISRYRIISHFGKWTACMVVLWSATGGLEGKLRTVIQIITAVFFFWQACLIIRSFFRTYHRAISQVENYYADNVDGFVYWLYKSTFGIIFFGLTSAVIAFAPQWGIAIQMSAGIFMFLYIFLSFMNYMLNYDSVEMAVVAKELKPDMKEYSVAGQSEKDPPYVTSVATDDADDDLLQDKREQNDAYHEQIAVALHQWIADEGFRENGITIEQVARHILSNRTYLSNFINSEFKCSFRTWINHHRIEYAKRVLISCPNMSIEQIARDSGFSSSTNFGKLFGESEKMPPSKWRKQQQVGNAIFTR